MRKRAPCRIRDKPVVEHFPDRGKFSDMPHWNRRQFLRNSMAAALAGSLLPARHLLAENKSLRISILHTTDLHSHILPTTSYEGVTNLGGFARCATQLARWRKENPASLLLDVGDLYQGTEAGFRTRGQIMRRCLEQCHYDGWVIGNHEFDWGPEPLEEFLAESSVPALCANVDRKSLGGKYEAIAPFLLREVGDVKIGVIGLTTPGMPAWFQPQFLRGFTVTDPVEAARRSANLLREQGAEVIILAGHMGQRPGGDDFANRVEALAQALPEAAVYLAGHTHREHVNTPVHNLPYTQASYHGIHAGKVDLLLDPDTHKLLAVEPSLALMDASIPFSPEIISLTAADMEESARILSTPVGRLLEPLTLEGNPSPMVRLIAESMRQALQSRGVAVDGVLHGTFLREDFPAGEKTVADMWQLIPYENYVLTAELSPAELALVWQEIESSRNRRISLQLVGLRPGSKPDGSDWRDASGRPLEADHRYHVAMNTYDASSAGNRLPRLGEIVARQETRARIHPVQTREAVITYLGRYPDGFSISQLPA
jgi:2',3'-cyclic-nucleotide 2'-phosphodiesterase/3'-nucleotidase